MKRLPPLGSLQAFIQVARLGSVKAAAETLGLSSPALTRRIQSLEQFVGVTLFERQLNAVHLNSRGKALLDEIEPLLEALVAAVDHATDDNRSMHVRIAVPSLFAAQRLVPALPSLREHHPQLIIEIETGAHRMSHLPDDVDAAITMVEEVDERYYGRLLEKGRIIAIGSKAFTHGQSDLSDPSNLCRTPILLHRQMPAAFDEWRKAADLPSLEPGHISYFDAGQLILDAAAEGLGIAFMLESHLVCSKDERLTQVFSESVDSPYSYWFVCSPTALGRRGVRIFHDWLFNQFGPHQPKDLRAAN